MGEVARIRVLEDVLLERERQDTSWDVQPIYGYDRYIQLAAVCFALAEECKKEIQKNENNC